MKLFVMFVIWFIGLVVFYDETFSTENVPKFRKIGDDMDRVQKRMREFYRNTAIGFTIVMIIAYFII